MHSICDSLQYFQWSPEKNIDSKSHKVNPGDVLFGSVRFNETRQEYVLVHTDMTDNWSVSTHIPVQKMSNGAFKNYTIAYVVMEKDYSNCEVYGPDGQVFIALSLKLCMCMCSNISFLYISH